MVKPLLAIGTVLTLVTISCKSRSESTLQNEKQDTHHSSSLNTCVAIRGNGHYITAHFGGLARLVEDIGPIDAIAGGSSGAISAFIYESMAMNPNIEHCAKCTETQRRTRLSLLLKSTRGLVTSAQHSPEAMAIQGLVTEIETLRSGLSQASKVDARKAAQNLQILLNSSNIRSIINWELFGMLYQAAGQSFSDLTERDVRAILNNPSLASQRIRSNPRIQFAVDQIRESFATFGSFTAANQEIFFRPGVIDFFAFIEIMGRVADFYAGRGPYDQNAMELFLSQCADPAEASFGKPWSDFAASTLGKSCADSFAKIATEYFTQHGTPRLATGRLNDPMGKKMPIIVATATIDGKADTAQVRLSQDRYNSAQAPNYPLSFEKIRAGYWAPSTLSNQICDKVRGSGDEKGRRCLPLGSGTWGDILPYSPAEPGLARAQPIAGTDRVSLGGWIDLAPIDSLKAIDCKHTIYLTRRRDEAPFVAGVARQLNMDQGDPDKSIEKKLFDLNDPKSSLSHSLAQADMAWCTDWNSFSDFEIDGMMNEAYCAETVIKGSDFTPGPYSISRQARDPIRGCTYKAPAGTARADGEICGRKR